MEAKARQTSGMRLRLLRLAIITLLLLGTGAGAVEPSLDLAMATLPPGTLSSEQLLARFSGQTVESVTAAQGRESLSYYHPGGELRQQRLGKTRRGHWRVTKEHQICLQMEDLPEKCRIVVREGEEYRKYIVRKNGRHQHTVTYRTFHPGNPFGL